MQHSLACCFLFLSRCFRPYGATLYHLFSVYHASVVSVGYRAMYARYRSHHLSFHISHFSLNTKLSGTLERWNTYFYNYIYYSIYSIHHVYISIKTTVPLFPVPFISECVSEQIFHLRYVYTHTNHVSSHHGYDDYLC